MLLVSDAEYDFSIRIGCTVSKDKCKTYYDLVMRQLCTKIDLGNYRPDGFSKCFISEYLKQSSKIFTSFINYYYNSNLAEDAYTNFTNESFSSVYLEAFKNIVQKMYTEDDYSYLYGLLTNAQSDEMQKDSDDSDNNTDQQTQAIEETKEETILEKFNRKYRLFFIDEKRYYEFKMDTITPVLENTVPYLFRYNNIEIYESTWKQMTLRILEEIDKLNPKSAADLLSLTYWWSKTEVFSVNCKTNFSPFNS